MFCIIDPETMSHFLIPLSSKNEYNFICIFVGHELYFSLCNGNSSVYHYSCLRMYVESTPQEFLSPSSSGIIQLLK